MTIIQAVIKAFSQNTLSAYLVALGVFIFTLLVLYLFKRYVLHVAKRFAKKTTTEIDDYVIEFLEGIHWPFYGVASLFAAIRTIVVPSFLTKGINYTLIFLVIFYAVGGLTKVIDYIVKEHKKGKSEEEGQHIKLLGTIFKIFAWSIALLLLLSNLGVNITSLVAGLGIGGIAIAFALQNVLTDLFSAFTIYFDKPFKVGDFIIIGQDMGTIKKIGLKSTRIQALQGQEIVVSNRELTSVRINNYKKMRKRRISFGFGVEYSTSILKLKKINGLVKDIFTSIKDVELDRVHFKEFSDSSLNFEVVYYLNSQDYNVYMDTQQEINLAIKEAFEKAKISMAFPTQTIHVKK